MSARILIVDDVVANLRLLEARLAAEYLQVVTATNGLQALEVCAAGRCDIVLLDVMMPGMDGLEVCRRLKADERMANVPVILITALDSPTDRVNGLLAGADDFLTKPVGDLALLTRVKSLVRLKMLTDELASRAATASGMGLSRPAGPPLDPTGDILIVEDRTQSADRIVNAIGKQNRVDVEPLAEAALARAAGHDYDLAIVSLGLSTYDGLWLCSQFRSLERTRQLPLLVIAGPEDDARLLRGLDLGVNDYLLRPIDRDELLARVRTQIRKKRYADRLRDDVQLTMEMAITDGLTGLRNRRYFERHLATLVEQAAARGKALAVLILDIDHFKAINDTHGHSAGDAVLAEFSRRMRQAVRGMDLAGRFGGEEFVIAMPETDAAYAYVVGERLRQHVAGSPFPVGGSDLGIPVTVSIGVSCLAGPGDTAEAVLHRADQALYKAKRSGRNRVVAAAA